mgnify:FL=1
MRINHVRALLSDTDKSILDIALTAGFRSSSRFYSTFGKYVACRRNNTANLANSAARRFPAKDDISISQKNSLAVDNKQ